MRQPNWHHRLITLAHRCLHPFSLSMSTTYLHQANAFISVSAFDVVVPRIELLCRIFITFSKSMYKDASSFQRAIKRYCFTAVFTSIFLAKTLHLYVHRTSLSSRQILICGPSFFSQDAIVVLLARMLVALRLPLGAIRTILIVSGAVSRCVSNLAAQDWRLIYGWTDHTITASQSYSWLLSISPSTLFLVLRSTGVSLGLSSKMLQEVVYSSMA